MAGDDAFDEGFLEAFDRVARVQGAEGRRDAKRAVAGRADGMALGAVRLGEHPAALSARVLLAGRTLRRRACREGERQGRDAPRCLGSVHGRPPYLVSRPARAQ
jgi:hypothetical protein